MLQPGEKVDVTYYLNDVSEPLAQVLMTYNEEGNFNAPYTYGLERIEVEALDATRPEAQDPLYYLYDGLGSVTFMAKPDGNKRDHYRYDAFGKPAPGNSKLSEDGRIVNHNAFGYTGEMWDQEAELLYLRARYYEPENGRFLSRDTYEGKLRDPLSRNLYAYVGNNPINYVDPTGHWSTSININKYLGAGSFVKGSIGGSLTKWGLHARVFVDIYLKVTYGGAGLIVGSVVAGSMVAKQVGAWLVKNTFTKEHLARIFGTFLGGTVLFKLLNKAISKVVTKSLTFLDGLIMEIPGATNVIWEGRIKRSFSWSL